MKYLILIAFLFTNLTYADDVTYVTKGQAAPYTGYLFTPEKERELRLIDQDYNFLKKENITLSNINKLYEANETIMQTRIENQNKEINRLSEELSKGDSILGKIGMFVLGAAVTTGITFGVSKAIK